MPVHSEKDVWKNEIFLPLLEVHLLTIPITNEILVIIQVQRKEQITGTCMIWTAIKSYHEKTLRKWRKRGQKARYMSNNCSKVQEHCRLKILMINCLVNCFVEDIVVWKSNNFQNRLTAEIDRFCSFSVLLGLIKGHFRIYIHEEL